MRKSILITVSLLVIASMLITGCGPAKPKELTGTLNVWSFTNEIRTMAIAFQGLAPRCESRLHHDPDDKR